MKLVINANSTKRELNAPFAVCVSNEDLESLRDGVLAEIERRKRHGLSYGWFTISPSVEPLGNTPPKHWDE